MKLSGSHKGASMECRGDRFERRKRIPHTAWVSALLFSVCLSTPPAFSQKQGNTPTGNSPEMLDLILMTQRNPSGRTDAAAPASDATSTVRAISGSSMEPKPPSSEPVNAGTLKLPELNLSLPSSTGVERSVGAPSNTESLSTSPAGNLRLQEPNLNLSLPSQAQSSRGGEVPSNERSVSGSPADTRPSRLPDLNLSLPSAKQESTETPTGADRSAAWKRFMEGVKNPPPPPKTEPDAEAPATPRLPRSYYLLPSYSSPFILYQPPLPETGGQAAPEEGSGRREQGAEAVEQPEPGNSRRQSETGQESAREKRERIRDD